ncbi:tail fiber domain-containing protein [bacterium]|nr:tail fiber domain-containing protein [bacterium]
MSTFTDAEKTDLLFKKFVGKPTTDSSLAYYAEPSMDARSKVFSDTQLFTNTIPTTRPVDGDGGWDTDPSGLTAGQTATWSDSNGTAIIKYYYQHPLVQVTPGNDMAYKGDDGGSNTLQNSIPFNYDAAGGYGIKLYRQTGDAVGDQIFDGTGQFAVDPDSGVLTFYHHSDVSGYVTGSNPPYLSFYKYLGTIGLPWSIIGSTGLRFNTAGGNKTVAIGNTGSFTDVSTYDLEIKRAVKAHDTIYALDIVSTSDERLKTKIKPILEPVDKVKLLEGVEFEWKSKVRPQPESIVENNQTQEAVTTTATDDTNNIEEIVTDNDRVRNYGLLAQQVHAVLPGAVDQEKKTGWLSVNYNSIVALLVNVVKDQQTQIDSLNAKVDALCLSQTHFETETHDELEYLKIEIQNVEDLAKNLWGSAKREPLRSHHD